MPDYNLDQLRSDVIRWRQRAIAAEQHSFEQQAAQADAEQRAAVDREARAKVDKELEKAQARIEYLERDRERLRKPPVAHPDTVEADKRAAKAERRAEAAEKALDRERKKFEIELYNARRK